MIRVHLQETGSGRYIDCDLIHQPKGMAIPWFSHSQLETTMTIVGPPHSIGKNDGLEHP